MRSANLYFWFCLRLARVGDPRSFYLVFRHTEQETSKKKDAEAFASFCAQGKVVVVYNRDGLVGLDGVVRQERLGASGIRLNRLNSHRSRNVRTHVF